MDYGKCKKNDIVIHDNKQYVVSQKPKKAIDGTWLVYADDAETGKRVMFYAGRWK